MTLLLTLQKLGAGATSATFTVLLAKATLRRRVAASVTKRARLQGIVISKRSMRGWLSREDVRAQLAQGTDAAVESVLSSLSWLVSGASGRARETVAAELLSLVLDEYQRALPQQHSAVFGTQRIRSDLAENQTVLLDAMQGPDIFETDVRSLHPWRGATARKLLSIWPATRNIVHLLVANDNRGAFLSEWAGETPTILNGAPAEVWCWLGTLALDHDEPSAARIFVEKGIVLGASPRSYWLARLATKADADAAVLQALRVEQPMHPLAEAIVALHDHRFDDGVKALSSWRAQAGNETAIKAILESSCAIGLNDLNRAVGVLLEVLSSEPEASGVMLRAAEVLLSRGRHGSSESPLSDFSLAYSYAIRVRDSRRRWQGDSTVAILTAVKAAVLCTDMEAAWRQTQRSPAGEATNEEATDVRLVRESAILAAVLRRSNDANALLQKVNDPYVAATVKGWNAFYEGNKEAAESAWLCAWQLADDDSSRLQTAAALAPLGGTMPPLQDFVSTHPKAVQQLKLIHSVMAGTGDRLVRLRARAHQSENLTVLLAELLVSEGKDEEAAETLEAGGERWHHPLLMRMAADRYLNAGQNVKASRTAEVALTLGGQGWAGELEALSIKFNALEADGQDEESMHVIRRMVMLAPDNLGARWALVRCLYRAGRLQEAWSALNYNGNPAKPREVHEAHIYMGLISNFDSPSLFFSRALYMFEKWSDDTEFAGTVLASIHERLARDDSVVSPIQIQDLHEATRSYISENPESPTFYVVHSGPEGDPLAGIKKELKKRSSVIPEEIQRQILDGELPVGLIADALRSSYAEVVLKRTSGHVYSHRPQGASPTRKVVDLSQTENIVIDTTAAVTLAGLPSDIRDQLIGAFPRISSTHEAFRDALRAQQTLQAKSTMSAAWSDEDQKIIASTISDDQANKLASRADQTVDILSATNRRSWPTMRRLTDLGEPTIWNSVLDFAADTGAAYWVDDLPLRILAEWEGLRTFGTVDILNHLVGSGHLTRDSGRVAESILIADFHVDLGFNADVMALAATIDGWDAKGAAASLARAYTWKKPEETMQFLLKALQENASRSPRSVHDWVAYAANGLVQVSSAEEPGSVSHNLRELLLQLIDQPWMRPDLFRFVIEAIRNPRKQGRGLEQIDPLADVLRTMHKSLLKGHDASTAAELLLIWAQYLDVSDRETAARVILLSRD